MPIDTLCKINPTSRECYAAQGPGIGAGVSTLEHFEALSGRRMQPTDVCLDIGCGDGQTLKTFRQERSIRKTHALGVDIALACKPVANDFGFYLKILDVSHQPLPHSDDSIDLAFCTETIEHLSNPYHMVCEVKRVLKHEGLFTLAFPMPEDNLGYGGGQHAHVYPGFLMKDSFERFMMQMYFKQVAYRPNGSSAWYVFKNYKGPGIVDVFEVISGNYTEQQLYGCLTDF